MNVDHWLVSIFLHMQNIIIQWYWYSWPITTNLSYSYTYSLEGLLNLWNNTFVNSKCLTYNHHALPHLKFADHPPMQNVIPIVFSSDISYPNSLRENAFNCRFPLPLVSFAQHVLTFCVPFKSSVIYYFWYLHTNDLSSEFLLIVLTMTNPFLQFHHYLLKNYTVSIVLHTSVQIPEI